jgi:hypothetical protein
VGVGSPEPRAPGPATGASVYARDIDWVVERRNLRQRAAFVETLA